MYCTIKKNGFYSWNFVGYSDRRYLRMGTRAFTITDIYISYIGYSDNQTDATQGQRADMENRHTQQKNVN